MLSCVVGMGFQSPDWPQFRASGADRLHNNFSPLFGPNHEKMRRGRPVSRGRRMQYLTTAAVLSAAYSIVNALHFERRASVLKKGTVLGYAAGTMPFFALRSRG